MKVLITGIAGFIGYHTALKFHTEGHTVFGFDNFNDYYDVSLKEARAANLSDHSITVEKADLRNYENLVEYINKVEPDIVIHLATMAGVRYSMKHAAEYIDVNLHGTNNLIRACEAEGIQNIIYASTSCVMHGHPLPWKEYDQLGLQLSPYGYTKATNESQFYISNIKNVVGLRFFTVYGPWGRPDMALFTFTKQILSNEPITVYNYGDMKRDFTHVNDIVQGIYLVSQNMTPRDIYCIGNGEQVNLLDFVRAIEERLNKTAEINFESLHPADAKETWSDITKIKQLGYKPTTSIKEGIDSFISWYVNFYGRNA